MPRRSRGSLLLAFLAVGALVAGVTAESPGQRASAAEAPTAPSVVVAAAPAPAAGWTTLFQDDFDGPAGSPVGAKWEHEIGTWGTGAIDRTTDSTDNVFLDGAGHLGIRALQNSAGEWTSGRIITADKSFSATEGSQLLMTASIKQPNPEQATGYWPAFWALGRDAAGVIDWPLTGEIDMMEAVNGASHAIQTFHCGQVEGGACDEPNGITSGQQDCVGCLTEYHTYSVLVDRRVAGAERLEFMVDGAVRFTVEQARVGQQAWEAAIARDYFLILNLAIGGGLPNGVCGCDSASAVKSSGGTMNVDHVAVYRSDALAPLTATTPTITGTARVGATLTASAGTWGPAPVTLAYQWKADGVTLAGATAATYSPVAATVGKRISVTVTGTKDGYATEERTSASTATVATGTLTASTPTITGRAAVGSILTATPGTWGPSPVTLTYQWRANGAAISRATGATYKPTSGMVGKRITVTVTGTKSGYAPTARTSAATAAVVG